MTSLPFKGLLLATVAGLALAACSQGGDPVSPGATNVTITPPAPPPPPPPPSTGNGTCADGSDGTPLGAKVICPVTLGNLSELSGTLTESATLPFAGEDVVYQLTGRLNVGADRGADLSTGSEVVLTIEPGVTIVGDSGADYIVVNRGNKLEASGNATTPIIFTSEADIAGTGDRENAIGEWGGLVILGNAPINRCNVQGVNPGTADCENAVEGVTEPDALYGGADADADSGALQYVQVRFAGFEVAPDVELNGITFGGVGRGTTLDHIQVHNNSDDGVEFFGGNADVKYLALTGNDDEQLDTDNGFQGNIQFVIATQRGGDSSDNGIEASSVAPGVTPLSNATIANFTLFAPDNTDSNGIRLNTGTVGTYVNGIIVDGGACLDYEDDAGDGQPGFNSVNDPAFRSVLFDCDAGLLTSGGDADPATGQASVDADANNVVTDNTLSGFFPGSRELSVEATDVTALDPFFDAVDYIGAFGPDETPTDNWATGWTQDLFDETGGCPAGTTDEGRDVAGEPLCSLSGTVEGALRLTRGNIYQISGRVNVGVDVGADGAAAGGVAGELIIEQGVTLFGNSGADYVVVNRGSRIFANGTAANPVVMTSQNDVTDAVGDRDNAIGEWGGLVILGDAPINRCNVQGATGGTEACENAVEGVTEPDALYGGSDAADSSGSLTYLQVKYAGFEVAPDVELNGITLGGVGAGTTLEYVQVHNNSDDGVEFFGGNANARYLVLTGNDDEQLDTDNGYQGSVQFMIARQRGGDSSDNGIEASSVAPGVAPFSDATIANFVLFAPDNTDSHGIRLNTGTRGTYANGVIVDGGACLDYEDDAGDGVAGFTAGVDPTFQSVLFDCDAGLLTSGGDADPVTGQAAVDADANNVEAGNTLADGFVNGTAEGAVTAADLPDDGFLRDVDYIGAVRDADDTWWQGWTCGLTDQTPC